MNIYIVGRYDSLSWWPHGLVLFVTGFVDGTLRKPFELTHNPPSKFDLRRVACWIKVPVMFSNELGDHANDMQIFLVFGIQWPRKYFAEQVNAGLEEVREGEPAR